LTIIRCESSVINKLEQILSILNNQSESHSQTGNNNVSKMTGEHAVANQYNFYSQQIFKPLKVNNKIEIEVYKNIFHNFLFYSFITFISTIMFVCFIAVVIGGFENIFNFVNSIIYLYVILMFIYFIIFFLLKYKYNKRLIITKDSITLKEKETITNISYVDIRSIVKKRNIFSYSLYIYKINKIDAYLEFDIDSMHKVNAIYELISNKICNYPEPTRFK